jgi:hypothetical protein
MLTSLELSVLAGLALHRRHHLALALHERSLMGRLMVRHLVRLAKGDVWHITERGLYLLDAGGAMH